jgi:hypothetical protein
MNKPVIIAMLLLCSCGSSIKVNSTADETQNDAYIRTSSGGNAADVSTKKLMSDFEICEQNYRGHPKAKEICEDHMEAGIPARRNQ